ncbi:MAG TPA: hypothetical protein VKU82_06130 [Planctomycetaceae bacterium]|nr:hypothetical protein [Planctomycetaceae bacterium]
MNLIFYTATRFLHVGTAVVVVGGTFFIRYILLPAAAKNLPDDAHARLRTSLMNSWKKIVHAGIALFLLTGAVNYYRVIADGSHKGDALYHALLGTKIILAMIIFAIASALVGRAPALEQFRRNSRTWLTVNVLLAAMIIGISGFLKVRGPRTLPGAASRPDPAASAEAERD